MKDTREAIARGNEEEEEEPPMLGDEDDAPLLETDSDNQREEAPAAPSTASDANLMDEMVAAAGRAKAEKRRVSERERNRTTFGDGLKKGFFNRPAKPVDTQKKAGASQPTMTGGLAREEKLRIVKPPAPETDSNNAAKASSFVFPEVQEAMKSAEQFDPKEWMNAQFFEKLAQNPKLAQALRNPVFSQAIADMQADPRAAMLKYQKDAAVSAMLHDFMAFLGAHFEEMGKQTADNHNQQQQQHVLAAKPAAIEDLDARRRAALADMPRSPQEEAQLQKIMADPELLRALSDGALMQRLRECQQAPGGLRALLEDARMGPKLKLLMDNGLVTFGA